MLFSACSSRAVVAPSTVEAATVVAVAESEPVRTTALAAHVGVDPSTMSRHITVLDQAGYVTRAADPDDGRAQAVSLTAAGRAVMEQARAARHDLITNVLAEWDDADRRHVAALLARLADDFVRVERAS